MLLFNSLAAAEPWINTTDTWLRADIETLADANIITVPITTFPLMWSGIIKDIDNTAIEAVPIHLKKIFWRVKLASKQAVRKESIRKLAVTISNSKKHFRSFGDSNREENELTAFAKGVSKNWAWNLQVSQVTEPTDGVKTRYDGSYVAGVLGNWVASVGSVEKWWGPTWGAADLISNNARTPIGISFSRNYSDKSNIEMLEYIGPWSMTAFVGQLEDKREVNNSYLTGLSVSFKPHQALETSLRLTQLSGGEAKLGVLDNSNNELKNERFASLDFRWRLPFGKTVSKFPISIYGSLTEQSTSKSKNAKQVGLSTDFELLGSQWKIYLENNQTGLYSSYVDSGQESEVRNYVHHGRNIGSSYSKNSKITTLGLMSRVSRYSSISLAIRRIDLSKSESIDLSAVSNRTSCQECKFEQVNLKWSFDVSKKNSILMDFNFSSEPEFRVDDQSVSNDKFKVGMTWVYRLD